MPQYTFSKKMDPDNRFDCTNVTVEVDTVSLNDLIEAFGEFLKGCGYSYNGTLEVVEPDEAQID